MSSRRLAVALGLALLLPIALPLVPTAVAATASAPGLPTFGVFAHPTSVGNSFSSEPTVGYNVNTGSVFFMQSATAWKVTFDLDATPPSASWADASPPNSIENIDPMMFADLGTGRIFAGGLDGECSIMSFTDDDGETWIPAGNQCAGAFDHQTIGQGPWADPAPIQATYDRATYYCAQGWINWPTNACVTSWDGGLVYSPPVNWEGECFGLHGHVNVSPNGRAYVPTRSCAGKSGFARSDDNGVSWQSYLTTVSSPGNGFDPSIGASRNDRIWMATESASWEPLAAYSDNGGETFSSWKNVGADAGIKTSTFLRVMSGDPDRAAVAYLGSTTDGNPFVQNWPGVWDLYVSYTYDSGATWGTVKVTSDPVQRGWMCSAGLSCSSGRNLLDFMGSTLDSDGRVIVGFADGCVGTCAGPFGTPGQSTSAWSTIARQLGGRGLYAEKDGASVDIVGTVLGGVGAPVTLSANVAADLPYTATVAWGDGETTTHPGQTASAFTATHTYAAGGQYDIVLTVTGADGNSASDATQASIGGTTGGTVQIGSPEEGDTVGDLVTVTGVVTGDTNGAPTAAFSFTVSGRDVSFNGLASTDPENDPLAYAWDFGDSSTGGGATTMHRYAAAGTYDACLTVSDGSLANEICKTVTITTTRTTVATDPEGDAIGPIPGSASIDDLDIVAIEASTTDAGEPLFVMTLKTLAAPEPHVDDGGLGAQWSIQWDGPQGTDFVSLDAGLTAHGCGWGFFNPDTGFLEGQGAAPCTVTPGTPGKITFTFPSGAMGSRGYVGSDALDQITGYTGVWQGTPTEIPVYAGQTTYVDTTAGDGSYTLGNFNVPFAKLGIAQESAAKPAPATPPADPEVTDQVVDPIGDTAPTTNVESAWFDADADNLYVGLKVADIPADPTSTAFIYYAVNFKPAYQVLDPTWGGLVGSGATFTGLRAFALYSPVRGSFAPVGVSSDTATVFEVHVLSTTTTGNSFGARGTVTGSIDAATDIIWWTIPRDMLQDPAGGAILEKTSAASAPAVGGVVTFGGILSDSTGDGDNYGFPETDPVAPVVSLAGTPLSGTAPLDVTFSASVTPAAITTWTIAYGDGDAQTGAAPMPTSFSHTYDTPGAYTATLSVTSPDGSGAASVGISAGSGPVPMKVLVTAGSAPPVEASCAASCATWTADVDLSSLPAGEVQITAALIDNGETLSTDVVTVTLARAGGVAIESPLDGTVVDAGSLTVSGSLSGAADLPPVASLSADKSQGVAPLAVEFTLGGTDDHGVTSWRFTTGDGRVVDGVALPTTISHTYTTAGDRTATLTVRDAGGKADVASGIIRVQAGNTPPTTPSSPTPAHNATNVALPVTLGWSATDADGNTLTYDVYINGSQVATDQTSSYMPTGLVANTTYTWRVVAKDGTASTTGPTWRFTTKAATVSEADKPHVVVAVIDSGTNPYHQQFRRSALVDHPSSYITSFPANAIEVQLCFFDNASKTVDQSRCPPSTSNAAQGMDLAQWQKLSVTPLSQTGAGQGNLAYFPGTNVFAISFNHAGDARFPTLDGSLGAADNHGTRTSSDVAGLTTGTCPECIIVLIEGDDVAGIEAAYAWAANQPWIDVITSSVSIGLIGLGANPADFFDATSQATRTAVENGKIVFEAAGNGVANAGAAPMSTFLYANSNPWTIPVGCSAEHTGQPCGYHDFPNAITASGVSRVSADVNTYTSTIGVGGTSFSSPSSAGVAARALFAARAAMNDTQEGPSTNSRSLLRVGPGASAPDSGPFENGRLSKLELEEVLLKTARRSVLPEVPNYLTPNNEIPNTPLGFVKEGFGNVYRGDWGVNGPGALATWSSAADMTNVILGHKDVPNRWFEEQWWEEIVEPVQVSIFGADVPEANADDDDAYPRNDPTDPDTFTGYSGPAMGASAPTPRAGLSATVPLGTVPTPAANRLYLHHNNMGPDPNSVNGNALYEKYINSIADPAGGAATCSGATCPDQNGVGATGANPTGSFTTTYTIMHPYLGGPLLLDRTKEVVVHIEATNYAGAPASPLAMNVQLLSGGTPVGGGSAPRAIVGTEGVYELRFSPSVDALTDTVELVLSWPGPVYSSHIQTRGASWIELPVSGDLPPVEFEPVTYYVDNFDADYASNGDTVTLTRDISRLAGDVDAGFTFNAPQAQGAIINLAADDALATGPALLGPVGSLRAYPCTFPFSNAGAAQVTVSVALRMGSTPIGSGSLTTTIAGLHDHNTAGVEVPLAMHSVLVPPGASIEGSVTLSGPGGVFAQNMGICGGGEAHPITLSLALADLTAVPSATIAALPETLSGDVTVNGTATFPAVPGATTTTWYATNAGDWTANGDVLQMETSAPGTASATFFEPTPGGVTVSFRSVRPAAEDAPLIATDGLATAQFWASPIGGAQDLTVDMTATLVDAQGNARLLGSASQTKHVPVDALGLNPWPDGAFVLSFVPEIAVPDADEHLVMTFNVHNVGDVLTSNVIFFGGDAAQPIFLALPRDADSAPSAPKVDVTIGGVAETVDVVGGAWSLALDTSTLDNGEHTLTVTPRAIYGGVSRTGVPATRDVTVANSGLNTAPSATLEISPASGFGPLLVIADIDGDDAQTFGSQLKFSLDWGDGSAPSTGTGVPTTRTHTYAVGSYVATLTITDAGDMVATASFAVTVLETPPVEKVVVLVDGASPVDAIADGPDGAFSAWHATVTLAEPGARVLTARHMRGSDVLSEDSILVTVEASNVPSVTIASPGDETVVPEGATLTGSVEFEGTIDSVIASIDDFATSVAATSTDGYQTFDVDLDALGLPEDAETLVRVRALSASADAPGEAAVRVLLNAAPDAAIDVLTALPAYKNEAVDLQAHTTPAASGAAISSLAWSFSDGASASGASASHAFATVGTHTATLTATDANGKVGMASASILVISRPPVVSIEQWPAAPTTLDSVTFTTSATDPDGSIASITTTAYQGATRDDGALSTGGSTLSVTFPDDGVYLVVGRAVDEDGDAAEVESLVVIHNARPIAALVATPSTAGVGQEVTLDATTSSDPDGSIGWYVFDLGDGTIVGQDTPIVTHSYDEAGTYLATVTVTDDDGSEDTSPAAAIVANAGPTLAPIGHKAVDEGVTLSFTASATDPENDPLTFTMTPLPSGATFDAGTGVFSWTPGFGTDGNYPVTVSVSDGRLADSEAIILSVGDVDLPPTLTPIGPKTAEEGETLSFVVVASDPDTATLTFSAEGLPAGATFSTGTFSWTPNYTQAGVYDVTFRVSDGRTTLDELVAITIVDADRAPVLNAISGGSVVQLSTFSKSVSATDPDGGAVSFSIAGPANMKITNVAAGQGTIHWTPSLDQIGNYTVTVFASSGTLTSSQTFVVRVIFKAGVAVTHVSPPVVAASPAEVVQVTAQIQNTGPHADTFRLSTSNSAGWKQTGVPTTVTLLPGETKNVTVSVTVNATKPVSQVSIGALSLGDGTTRSEATFRIDVPTFVNVNIEASGVPGTDVPRGNVTVTFLDGSPVAGARVTITQTPELWGTNFRYFEQGYANAGGVYDWDFTTVKGGVLPGPHTLHVAAKMVGGQDTVVVTAYHIGTGGVL